MSGSRGQIPESDRPAFQCWLCLFLCDPRKVAKSESSLCLRVNVHNTVYSRVVMMVEYYVHEGLGPMSEKCEFNKY